MMQVLRGPPQLAFPVSTASPLHTDHVCCAVPVRGSSPVWLLRLLSSLASAPSPFGCCFVNQLKQRMDFAFPILSAPTWLRVLLLRACLAFLSLCSSAPLLPNHYLFPECLFFKCFLSALPVISFSCMFYFWVMLPIRINSAVTPTQIICRSVFSVAFFPCSATISST